MGKYRQTMETMDKCFKNKPIDHYFHALEKCEMLGLGNPPKIEGLVGFVGQLKT